MSLSDDQVRRLARLARIAIAARGIRRSRLERLNRVLGLVDEMRARRHRRASSPCPTPWTLGRSGCAPDEVTETDRREAYQSVAPAVEEGCTSCPR